MTPDRPAAVPPAGQPADWAPAGRAGQTWTAALPALSRATVPRAAHRRSDDAWLAEAWRHAEVLVVSPQGEARVRYGGTGPRLVLGRAGEAPPGAEPFFIGELDARPYFGVVGDLGDARAAGLREIGAFLDDRDAGLLVTAVALANWHRTHRHCPRCGRPTAIIRGGWARQCPVDGSEHYPRVDPAIIVLVHDGADRCLLGRQSAWPPGRYSCLAGFVEPGESAEQALVREVAEEARVRVGELRYVASQPWPFPSSLMLGFVARAAPHQTPAPADGELEDVRWFSRDELRGRAAALLPPPVSIAHRLITGWLDHPP